MYMLLSAGTHRTLGRRMLHGPAASRGSRAGEISPSKLQGLSWDVCAPAWMTLLPLAHLQLQPVEKMSLYIRDTQTYPGHWHGWTHRLHRQGTACNSPCVQETNIKYKHSQLGLFLLLGCWRLNVTSASTHFSTLDSHTHLWILQAPAQHLWLPGNLPTSQPL